VTGRSGAALILGVETSCDDTSIALLRGEREELALVSQTQVAQHAPYGGVVPEAASRIHAEIIGDVCQRAVAEARVPLGAVDAIAVTHGPGLPGSLLVGVAFAEGLAYALQRPLVPVNHLEGHLASPWLTAPVAPAFPAVALIVSGGHTELIWAAAKGRYRLLGRTRDDAAGEAFDKVARLLGLPFPGGPAIQAAAAEASATPYRLPRATLPDTLDFSFSGLKTAVLRLVERRLGPAEAARILGTAAGREASPHDRTFIAAIARALEEAIVDALVDKTVHAARRFGAASIVVAGGVSANLRLRAALQAQAPAPLYLPALRHCGDNASMIALAGSWRWAQGDVAQGPVGIEPSLQLAR